MNYQQLIDATLQQLHLDPDDVSIVQINYPNRTVTIINRQMQKFVRPFPPAEAKPAKRTKLIKHTD